MKLYITYIQLIISNIRVSWNLENSVEQTQNALHPNLIYLINPTINGLLYPRLRLLSFPLYQILLFPAIGIVGILNIQAFSHSKHEFTITLGLHISEYVYLDTVFLANWEM